MLDLQPITVESADILRKYYSQCTYHLCEYSAGVKLMWQELWGSRFAETNGCLVVLHNTDYAGTVFDYPVPLPETGDVDTALDEIDQWCMKQGTAPAFQTVPAEQRAHLLDRYPYAVIGSSRLWQDYLYHAEDLSVFAGRHYAGQRNHIHKFQKLYPNAVYRPLTQADSQKIDAFWEEFHKVFNKDTADAKYELCAARKLMQLAGRDWVRAAGIELDGKLLALSLGEVCGDMLICHVEKGLPQYNGVYPTMVQSFAAANSQGLLWINREDDSGDPGLRTSKTQYLPAAMGAKYHVRVQNELDNLKTVPELHSGRLTLDALTDSDQAAYNRLCLDDDRNQYWGYDYRQDLHGELTDSYFLDVARHDLEHKLAVNFAVRLDGQMIGEAVLYDFDYKGSAELGCRIFPEYAGHGYGKEAFRCAAEWSLYGLGLYRLRAKCFQVNPPARLMLENCMRLVGQDDTFYHFEKTI